jgi:hypothetical protein
MNTILNDIDSEPHVEPQVLESSANRSIRLSLATPIHVSYSNLILGLKRQKLTGLETDIACLKTNLSLKILFKNI